MANSISDNRRNNGAKPKSKLDRVLGLRDFLARPENRGRKISNGELARHFNKSAQWIKRTFGEGTIAQEWLTANQDAPLDVKVFYQDRMNKSLNEIDPKDIEVRTGEKTFFVSKEQAKETTIKVASTIKTIPQTAITVVNVGSESKQVTEQDMLIDKIREAYVLAPIGEMPNISKMMIEFGLLSKQGVPLKNITEEQVRLRMIEEDWKSQRSDYLYKTLDIIPDEIKLVAMVRNVEINKMLFNEMKHIHRMNQQYYANGKAMSIDKTREIEWRPDPGSIATIAEVMRRMMDGGGNVNILNINQFGEGGGNKGQANISPVVRTYLARIQKLNTEDMVQEVSQFEQLIESINAPSDKVTRKDLEAQDEK
ncbi:MAG: hypothetical protein ACXVCY_04485 [Pseudobdellovibrionaceae bacterium]